MAVIMSKTFTLPSSEISASDLDVGSSVFLNVNGISKEFLVVHQGLPSSIYDSSCNGTWLLMKDIYIEMQYDQNGWNYEGADAQLYCDDTFYPLLDADVQSTVITARIPYTRNWGGIQLNTGSNGLDVKCFLLAAGEVNFSPSNSEKDGTCLSYFSGCEDADRIAYFNGTACKWALRTMSSYDVTYGWSVGSSGSASSGYGSSCQSTYGIRPALILPSNTLFDSNTMEFVGVN